jgi:hypothetical protein
MNGYGYPQNYIPGMSPGPMPMPNYGGSADPLKLFTQQPSYSPIPMSPGLMSNPLGLAIGLYGTPMVQNLAGPGSFVPNLMRAGGTSDQFMAHHHQRQAMHATFATARHGQDSAQNAITGMMSLATGQRPNQLMREHADMAAGVVNDPFVKMALGSVMGQDTMEQMLYGSKGDPAALAGAVGRVGFYRRGSTGNRRMTGEQMAEMSSNMYEQMYGANADIADMRGFGAGQAGQLFEHLTQTGRLPQSIGALSAADRVKAVAAGPRDEGTLNRLSEEFAQRELAESNPEISGRRYSDMTREEQKSEVARRLPETRNRLESTLAEVDKFATTGGGNAADIEKLAGFDKLAGNVDTSRATSTLKEYAGAVKAVQQIFGAAGNSNAPFPALLAVLNQLTAGGSLAMPATKVESNIKQLHNAAKDAGMSVEQMMQVHQIQAATNRAAGISPEADMSGAASVIRSMRAANEAGEFGMGYGRMSQSEAAQVMAQQNASGQTSNAGRKMAALARMVDNSPETMGKDTDAGRLIDAYKNKQTHFTNTKGEKVDIGQALLDPNFVTSVVERAGGNAADLQSLALDPVTQQRYGQEMGEYVRLVAQPKQVQQLLANEYGSMLQNQRGEGTAAFQRVQQELGANLDMDKMDVAMGQAAATSIIEKTTADMSDAQKFDVVSKDMKAAIDQQLKAAGVENEADRERQTEAIFNATMGEKRDQQVQRFGGQFLARGNRVLASITAGMSTIEQAQQLYRQSVVAPVLEERRADADLASRQIAMDRGHETNIIQRTSDELQRLGRGEETDMAGSIERILNAVPIAEMAEKGAPELAAGLKSASQFGGGGKDLVNAYNTGRAEDIQAAAAMMAKNALGETASVEDIAKFTQTALTGTPEDLTKALEAAGVKKEDQDKFLTAATGLKTAKDFSFSRMFGENLSPEQFAAHERRMQVRGAAATAAKMDEASRTPDGLKTRVARSFDALTRAEGAEAKQTATEELARQVLGTSGTPESIAEMAEALAAGEAYTPEELAKRKLSKEASELSKNDDNAVDAVAFLQKAKEARAAGKLDDEKRASSAADRNLKLLGVRQTAVELGLMTEAEAEALNYESFEESFSTAEGSKAVLNGKELTKEQHAAITSRVEELRKQAKDAGDDPAKAAFISDKASAHLDRKTKYARGEYDFTAEEEKKTVGAMRSMSPAERDRVRMLALGVKASSEGPPLTAEQREVFKMADVMAGRDAAAAMSPEAAAALDSVLDNKTTDNVKSQAAVLARSIYGEGATDAQVAALADSMVAAGESNDYTSVTDIVDGIHGGDNAKRQQAMDVVTGFNAARGVREKSADFISMDRRDKVEAANKTLAGFGKTSQLGFQNYKTFGTDATKEEFLRILGQDIGIANVQDGEAQDAFVKAMKSGDKEQIAAATANLKLSEDKQNELLRISEGVKAYDEETSAQKETAEAAKRAAETARDVSVDTRAKTEYGINTSSLGAAGQERPYTLDSTMGPGSGYGAPGGFFGTGAESLALSAGADAAGPAFGSVGMPAPVAGGAGGKEQKTTVSGTLKLQGLQEVIADLIADNNMEPTPDGAMVDMGTPNQAYRGSRPATFRQV